MSEELIHWWPIDGSRAPRCRSIEPEADRVFRLTVRRDELTCPRCIALVDPSGPERQRELRTWGAWLIWNNLCNMWWRPNERGYTRHIADAGRYTLSEARALVERAWTHGADDQPNVFPALAMQPAPETLDRITEMLPPAAAPTP